MKRILRICKKAVCLLLSVVIFSGVSSIFFACTDNNIYDGELLRLHIRANSNSELDQSVKLKVRDEVNAYIAANIEKSTFAEAYASIERHLSLLAAVADGVLRRNGFYYGARARLCNEYFPARMYKDVTVPDGNYDALIIELGDGAGDNWWCVVYPPLCYGDDFKYRSFFAELFGGRL